MRRSVSAPDAARIAAIGGELAAAIAAEISARGADPAVPGQVYERLLAADRRARRAGGAFYTPAHLVDLVVEWSLGPALAGRDADEALALRVADLACGGGVFLLAALARIERHCVERGMRGGVALRRRIAERCLAGVDVDATAVAVTRLSLAMAVGAEVEAALHVGDALDAGVDVGRVDVVLGNPPWGRKGFSIDAETRRRYRAAYRCARGLLEPSTLFVERAHQILAPGGRWGLVLPDIVLLKDHEAARALMLEQSAIERVAHAGRAFAGVNLDACVIAGRVVARPAPHNPVRIWHQVPERWRDEPPAETRREQGVFAALPGRRFNLHLEDGDLALMRRLAALPRLGELFEVHEGVHTGNARAKLFLPRRAHDACVPVIVGRRELSRYRLAWGGTWLDVRPEALDREAGDYASLGRPAWHRREKLVVRRTGDRVIAAHDADGTYVSNNLFVVLPKAPMASRELRAFAALCNSALYTWAFRVAVPRVGKLFAELKITHLAAFPAPPPGRWTAAIEELARLAERGRRDGADAVAAEVDAAVARLYELSPAEAARVAAVASAGARPGRARAEAAQKAAVESAAEISPRARRRVTLGQ